MNRAPGEGCLPRRGEGDAVVIDDPGEDQLLANWEIGSPMRWDPDDPEPVADAVCFLLSDFSRAITGEILHVDGGYHAMAGALKPGPTDEADAG